MLRSLLPLLATALFVLPARSQCPDPSDRLVGPDDGQATESFGSAMAVEGTTLAVGAPGRNAMSGAVHVFEETGGAWKQVRLLRVPGTNELGSRVALSGDCLMALQPGLFPAIQGEVYVFERDLGGANKWGLAQSFLASDGVLSFGAGGGLAMSGDRALVTDHNNDGSGFSNGGAVYVFDRVGGVWVEQAKLYPSDVGMSTRFGSVLSMTATTAAIGSADAVYVFERGPLASTWTEVARLAPTLPGLYPEADVDGTTLVIGENQDATYGTRAGKAFVYDRDPVLGTWSLTREIVPTSIHPGLDFGVSVELRDGVVIVSGIDVCVGNGTGFVFERDLGGPDAWGERGQLEASPPVTSLYPWRILGSGALAGNSSMTYQGIASGAVLVFDDITVPIHQPFETYCTAGTTSEGCRGFVAACGFSSASAASGFELTAAGLPGGRQGLFFYGTGGRQALPWGNGTSVRCVVPPVQRTPLGTSTGDGSCFGGCHGTLRLDLNAQWTAKPAQNPGAGALVQAQLWFRDPANTSNLTSSMSDAVEFTVGP